MSKTQRTFFKGALILTIAGILGKLLGALYRIPFVRIVGEEASALYGQSYSVYSILFALSTAGIPLAVSKLVAVTEERRETGESVRIFKITFITLSVLGLILSFLVFFNADWIAGFLFNEPRAALSLKALSPAMTASCMMSAFRGFFNGREQMVPTAVSQILEQFFRVGTIFLALFLLADRSIEEIVAGASFGSAMGGIVGFLFLGIVFLYLYFRNRDQFIYAPNPDTASEIIKKLLYLAIPISIGALVLPLMQFIDSTLIVRRLVAGGFIHQQALILYGHLATYAMPIINLPFIITTAIAASMVPTIAEAFEAQDDVLIIQNMRSSLTLTVLLMLPASVGIAVLGKPIAKLLFAISEPGVALSWVSFAVLSVGIYQVSSAVLQGLGRVLIPMWSLIIMAFSKVLMNWFLPLIPHFGIRGPAVATAIAVGIGSIINIVRLSNIVSWKWLAPKYLIIKPLVASIAMALMVKGVYYLMVQLSDSISIATGIAIIVGAVFYFVVLFAIKGIEADAVRKFPKIGPKLANKLER